MLVMIVLLLSSCAWFQPNKVEYQIRTIPVLAQPVIPVKPSPPNLASQLPITIEISAEDAAYFLEACEAWKSGEYTDIDMATDFPGLSRANACDWIIVGNTVQDSITLEDMWNQAIIYMLQLKVHADMLEKTIQNMYEVSQQTQEALND